MKKFFISILIGAALLATAAQPAFASYWKQDLTQSSSEVYGGTPVGQFDGMGIIWQSAAKFTPFAFSDFKTAGNVADGDWTIHNYSTVFATAESSTLKDFTKFSINFDSTLKPAGTSFYYGLFNKGEFIGGQSFAFDGVKWSAGEISEDTWNTAAASVTPEPISTALFLIGGAALGSKKLLRKKK